MINKNYLQDSKKLKRVFQQDAKFSNLILFDFFEDNYYQKFKKEIGILNFKKERCPLTHSYSKAEAGSLLIKFINSKEFKKLVGYVTGYNSFVQNKMISVYNLSWQDYVILNDQKKEEGKFDVVIDFTKEWGPSYGGDLIYVNGSGDFLRLPIKENSFAIVKKGGGVTRFIKYVNNHAKDKMRLVVVISF